MPTKFRIKNKIYISLAIAFILSAAAGITSCVCFKNQADLSELVEHSYQVINTTQNVQKLALYLDAGRSRFKIVNEKRFLLQYDDEILDLNAAITKLKQIASDDPKLINKVALLEKNIDQLLDFWKNMGPGNGSDTKEQLTKIISDEQLQTDEIRSDVDAILQTENKLLAERDNDDDKLIKLATWVSFIDTILTLSIILILIALVIRELRNGKVIIDKLNEFNVELVHKNEEKEKKALELIKATRLYAFISQINQTISHSIDDHNLFKDACHIAVDIGKFKMAWIGMADTENKKISLIDGKGIPPEDIKLFTDIHYDNNAPQDRAITSGAYYICNDTSKAPETLNWKPFAIKQGVNSYMVLPIKKAGIITGTFNLYASSKNFFDQQEINLLEEVAGDISFALDLFGKEKHRKEMVEALAQSETNMHQIIDLIPQFISTRDIEGKYLFVNKSYAGLSGLAPKELITKSMLETIPVESEAANFLKQDQEVFLTGKIKITPENTLTDYKGDVHIFHTVKVPFIIAGTNTKAVLGIGIDITEQKQAETERTKMLNDIVQRNQDLEQFSYIVSHNLRAPVANILGLVDILQSVGVDNKEEKVVTGYLAIAAKNLDNVIMDINSILELKHHVNEKRELIKFSELLGEVEYSLDNAITDENVQIRSDFSEIHSMISLKSYLYSIFYNLISNSIKYRQPNTNALIEITSSLVNDNIIITFKDNGMGIDMKQNSNYLFGLYKRFHNHVDGKGMGLYMVKTQVESLGGKITVKSEVNKGTEFTIEFGIS